MNTAVAAFLGRHNFSVHQDINPIVDAMLYDFDQGLKKKKIGSEMIRTFKLHHLRQLPESQLLSLMQVEQISGHALFHLMQRELHPSVILKRPACLESSVSFQRRNSSTRLLQISST